MYWSHPQFVGGAWNPENWRVSPESLVNDLARHGRAGVAASAIVREAGKPHSISEYDHPAPNLYRSETVPVAAIFGAQQDWDAIYLFSSGPFGSHDASDLVANFFDVGNDPSKFGLFPAAAVLFRDAALPVHPRVLRLRLPPRPWKIASNQHAHWSRLRPFSQETAIAARWEIEPRADVDEPEIVEVGTAPGRPPVRLEPFSRGHALVAEAPRGFVASGFIGGESLSFEAGRVEIERNPSGHASLAVVSLDGQPTPTSSRLLVTLVGQTENVGMTWNEERSSVSTGWGEGPVHCEPLTAHFRINRQTPATVYALDPAGQRKHTVPSAFDRGRLTFSLEPEDQTIWLEVATDG